MAPTSAPPAALQTPLAPAALEGGSAFYVSGEDALLLTGFNAAAGVTVRLTGRFLDLDAGRVQDLNQSLTPSTNRTASTVVVPLGVGWLLDATVLVTAGTPLVGQTYARISLQRGLAASALELTLLAQGYITTKQGLPILGDASRGFLEDGGALRSITGTTPGAGAEVSETVPTGARWALIAFEVDLTTSGVAANRVPELTIDDGVNVYARSPVNQNETASQTWRHSFQQGIPQIFDGTRFRILQPLGCELMLAAGHRIKTVTAALDVGDQWASPKYLVREWIEA